MKILIIAEKPSQAKDYARIVGAKAQNNGYYEGNNYIVSWSFGHLIGLADSKEYGFQKWKDIPSPFFPDFKLILKDDSGIIKQFNTLKKLMEECDMIINGTDAGREGELIFRYIYEHSGCKTPFKRLWISSLTDASIRKGLKEIKEGSEYDNLYFAAKARSESDWLVGINSTVKITLKTNTMYSIGRVQTPILALIYERCKENNEFQKIYFYQLAIKLADNITAINPEKFDHSDNIEEKMANIVNSLEKQCKVKDISIKSKKEKPNLLYDLTTLQRECNKVLSLTADDTLRIAQLLYEKKVITYPRTDCNYLPTDMLDNVIALTSKTKIPLDSKKLTSKYKKVFDNSKLSDHHAIIITEKSPTGLTEEEQKVYKLVYRKFIAAFAFDCEKEIYQYTFSNKGYDFIYKTTKITKIGWRAVYNESDNSKLLECVKNDVLDCAPYYEKKETKPKPIYNDASLLSAMENCGKELDNEEQKALLKGKGIGTPATRSEIIKTLIKREYIFRDKKRILITEKGVKLIELLKDKEIPIINAQITGDWEHKLVRMSQGDYDYETFMGEIRDFTSEVIGKLEDIPQDLQVFDLAGKNIIGDCPACGGKLFEGTKGYGCSNWKAKDCKFVIWKSIAKKEITESTVKTLLKKGRTPLLKGFLSKENKKFDAILKIVDNEVKFDFSESDGKKKIGKCPICEDGTIVENNFKEKVWFGCTNWKEKSCKFSFGRIIASKKITDKNAKDLVKNRKTELIQGFVGKKGEFDAFLVIKENEVKFEFDNTPQQSMLVPPGQEKTDSKNTQAETKTDNMSDSKTNPSKD